MPSRIFSLGEAAAERGSDPEHVDQRGGDPCAGHALGLRDAGQLELHGPEGAERVIAAGPLAERGEIRLELAAKDGRRGIVVVAEDNGPGIPDIEQAMQDGFSTGRSLGLGLPGARRLMDEFEIVSAVGKGTTITMRKWRP